jgi:hypothetical protein
MMWRSCHIDLTTVVDMYGSISFVFLCWRDRSEKAGDSP